MPEPETTERTEEYRVVADSVDPARVITLLHPDELSSAEGAVRAAALYVAGGAFENPRAQARTITPWVDLDDGEGK